MTYETYGVRVAQPEDLSALTELMYDYIVGFYQNPAPPVDNVHQLIRTLLDQKQGIQFVAEADGHPVGFATLYFTFSTMKAAPIAVMNDLFVAEPYRDTDVEKALFTVCKQYSLEHGFANMTWITSIHNTRAQTFFTNHDALQGKDWVHFSLR